MAPCLADTPAAQVLERAVLESRVRQVEEENRRIRLQLSQSQDAIAQAQDGNYGNQQWVTSADTGPEDGDNTAEEKSNRTECPRSPAVQKCEVSGVRLSVSALASGWFCHALPVLSRSSSTWPAFVPDTTPAETWSRWSSRSSSTGQDASFRYPPLADG